MYKRYQMKHADKISISILSLAFFIIIIFGSFNVMIFNKSFYTSEYYKTGTYAKISPDENYATSFVNNVTNNIFKYFRGTEDLKYFTDDEKSHMRDVKKLIITMQIIYYAAIISTIILFFYIYKNNKKDKIFFIELISKSLIYGSIASLIFLVTIFISGVYGFESFFYAFHQIFFPQGNWMFNANSLLIILFSERFFIDISLRIFIYALFQSLVFLFIGYYIRKQVEKIHKYKI